LTGSVTSGLVSATGRTLSEGGGIVLVNMVQTSAPIYPGNSGGALVDLRGSLIGILTVAVHVPTPSGAAAPSIGFAVASDVVRLVVDQLVSQGKVTRSERAALQLTAITDTGQSRGVVIVGVEPGGAAERAGLRSGDVILSVDGQAVTTIEDVALVLAELRPGVSTKVRVRDQVGHTRMVSVRLGELTGG
jgi:S1-C subfamily serine protease